jgi:hypothetical protein
MGPKIARRVTVLDTAQNSDLYPEMASHIWSIILFDVIYFALNLVLSLVRSIIDTDSVCIPSNSVDVYWSDEHP